MKSMDAARAVFKVLEGHERFEEICADMHPVDIGDLLINMSRAIDAARVLKTWVEPSSAGPRFRLEMSVDHRNPWTPSGSQRPPTADSG